jgi:hypothetical protein
MDAEFDELLKVYHNSQTRTPCSGDERAAEVLGDDLRVDLANETVPKQVPSRAHEKAPQA